MSKSPPLKFLLSLLLFTAAIVFLYSYISWAYLQDLAEEYRFKADRFQSEGNLDLAIKYYQKAIGLDKYSAASYNGLAICYEKKGWLRRAEQEYLRALKINPLYAPAHYNLGLFYERYGDIKKAIFHWKQRIRLGEPSDRARINARKKLEQYAPEELKAEEARELALFIVQQKEKEALDKILGRDKYRSREEKIQDYYLEGIQFYRKGDYRRASEYFHKMIETLPVSN